MKKNIVSLLTIATLSTVIFPTVSVYAAEQGTTNASSEQIVNSTPDTTISKKDTSQGDNLAILDPYIKVIANEYVLVVPENVHIDSTILQQTTNMISQSNTLIKENNATIDPITKTATFYDNNSIQLRAYKQGVNKVTVHWNRVRIYLSKSTVTKVQGGSLGALGFLIGKVPDVRVQAVSAVLIGIIGTSTPKGGLWFDYNYFYGVLGGTWGWQ